MDFIEPTQTKRASPIVLEQKKDGTLHFCVNYQKLNAVTIQNSYTIPGVDERIDSMGNATKYLTLDVKSRYWQVEFTEQDCKKTSFPSHHRLSDFPNSGWTQRRTKNISTRDAQSSSNGKTAVFLGLFGLYRTILGNVKRPL